jgi:DNA repair exonuclease SbcCD ATPase subunit
LLHIFQEWELSAYVKGVTDDPDESPFLNSLLRHHQVPDSELMTDQDVPHLVKDLYQILLEAAASGKEPASEKLDHIVQQYQQATSLLMPWTGLSDQLRALLEKRDARIAELAPALKDAQHYVRARERDIEELNRQIEALGETIKTLQMNSN